MAGNGRGQSAPLSNEEIAGRLEEVGGLLEVQGANPFRVRAYQNAAALLRTLPHPVRDVLTVEGPSGLERLPGIGRGLARSIEQLITSGRLRLLDRLRGEAAPERLLASMPGVGPKLATRVHEQLGIESLAELEAAAHDGRLSQVPGFGAKRVQGIREAIAGRFRLTRPSARTPRRAGQQQPAEPTTARPTASSAEASTAPAEEPPSVAEILDIDREYRQQAKANRLPRIAPKRFNPGAEAWLPILHTERNERHYTALFSNTARAHELGTIRDWVVIYRDDHDGDGQWTVVTSRFGRNAGKRIIRGREAECAEYYAQGEVQKRF